MDAEREVLRRAGLTEYQARAYHALLTLGSATAVQVADASRVPRTRIYTVLKSLEDTWVTVEETRPRRYSARDPAACLDEARREYDEIVRTATPALVARYTAREQRFAGPLWLLEGSGAVERRSITMASRARESLLLGLPPHAVLTDSLVAALADAHRRGVHLRIAGSPEHQPRFQQTRIPYRVAAVPFQVLVVDATQGLLAMVIPRAGGAPAVKAIWNPNPELAGMLAEAIPHALGWSSGP